MAPKISVYTSNIFFTVPFLLFKLIFRFQIFYIEAAKSFLHIMSKFHENIFISFKNINVETMPYQNPIEKNDIDCSPIYDPASKA